MGKAYRWRGGLLGKDSTGNPVFGGVLHIRIPDGGDGTFPTGRVVVIPRYSPGECERACIIRDPVNLAALGEARIADLVKVGSLEPVKWSDDLLSWLHADSPMVERDTAEAQRIAQESATASAAALATFGQPANTITSAIPAAPSSLR